MLKDVLETGINQLSHPNPNVRARLVEVGISDCPSGCRYYTDPKTKQVVLHHNPSFGCSKTRRVIEREQNPDYFQGMNYWMIPIKDRFEPDYVQAQLTRAAVGTMERGAAKANESLKALGDAAKSAGASMREMAEANKPKKSRGGIFRKRGRGRD